ncbi:hypothetical protein Rhopal_000038-T1 [Rhodotorula paludigena]|uniref:Uncharacterized protein n=1 Tax=Rhodotorula paludigena TaxID=86838 RepID=A0AAV5G9R4_9BASI|nr:hypothetical protein Rhopal_000038-T1 [Rhodotorula paludigena]
MHAALFLGALLACSAPSLALSPPLEAFARPPPLHVASTFVRSGPSAHLASRETARTARPPALVLAGADKEALWIPLALSRRAGRRATGIGRRENASGGGDLLDHALESDQEVEAEEDEMDEELERVLAEREEREMWRELLRSVSRTGEVPPLFRDLVRADDDDSDAAESAEEEDERLSFEKRRAPDDSPFLRDDPPPPPRKSKPPVSLPPFRLFSSSSSSDPAS